MTTPRILAAALALATIGAGGSATARAQDKQDNNKNDAAKPGKTAKEKAPAPSFTDEDLKKYKDRRSKEEPTSVSSGTESARRNEARRSESELEGEGQWPRRAGEARQPLDSARARVAQLDEQIEDLRQQMNPMSTRYVMGSNSSAGPDQLLQIQQRLGALEAELPAAKQALLEAEKAWAAFVAEAKSAGFDPSRLDP